jgi:hypothetical protein
VQGPDYYGPPLIIHSFNHRREMGVMVVPEVNIKRISSLAITEIVVIIEIRVTTLTNFGALGTEHGFEQRFRIQRCKKRTHALWCDFVLSIVLRYVTFRLVSTVSIYCNKTETRSRLYIL